jgi:hypothetical protein
MTDFTIPALSRLLAEDLKAITDQLTSEQAAGYTDWSASFVLGAVTTAPTKGNSTYNVAYRRSANGDVVDYEGYILIGSTFAAGSGVYRFPVPVNASAGGVLRSTGVAYIFDNGTANRHGVAKFDTAARLNIYLDNAASALTNAGSGTAWATGDIIQWSIRYPAA